MKTTVLRELIKRGVETASRIAQKSITLPILSHILVKAEKDFMEINATDLELGFRFWVPAKTEQEGMTTVPAKALANLLSSARGEQCLFLMKEGQISVSGGGFSAKLVTQGADEYPLIPRVEGGFLKISSRVLCEALGLVVDVTAKSQFRPELSGVYFSISKDSIVCAASDSFRLAEVVLLKDFTLSGSVEGSYIVPQRAVREIIALLESHEGEAQLFFTKNQCMCQVQDENTKHPLVQLVTQLIEGTFPAYRDIIPSSFVTTVTCPPREFMDALRSASIFSGKDGEVTVTIKSKNEVLLFARNRDIGENEATFAPSVEGENMVVVFNYRYLLDGLVKCSGKSAALSFTGPETPAVLRDVQRGNFLYVVMPIKSS